MKGIKSFLKKIKTKSVNMLVNHIQICRMNFIGWVWKKYFKTKKIKDLLILLLTAPYHCMKFKKIAKKMRYLGPLNSKIFQTYKKFGYYKNFSLDVASRWNKVLNFLFHRLFLEIKTLLKNYYEYKKVGYYNFFLNFLLTAPGLSMKYQKILKYKKILLI